jgi:hypothetical protein
MTVTKLQTAMTMVAEPGTNVGELCDQLGITRQTLCRHTTPGETIRPDGTKLLDKANKRK